MGTTPEITFRKMTPADIATVKQIEIKSQTASWSISYYQTCLQNKNIIGIVAEIDKNIVAYTIWDIDNNSATVMKFAVNPEFQRRSIGKRLFTVAIQIAYKLGAKFVILRVRRSNEIAIRFYESFGLKIIAVENNYYHINEDALIMAANIVE